jgi:hypothetical protein
MVEHTMAAATAAAMAERAAPAPAMEAVPAALVLRSAGMEAGMVGVKVMSHETILFRYIGYPTQERYI